MKDGFKKCTKCGEIKPHSEFHKDKSRKDGYATSCKSCRKKYHENNKEKRKVYFKEYHEKHKEERNKYFKEYNEKHKEEKIKYFKEYHEKHKEERKEIWKEYSKEYHKKKCEQSIEQIYINFTQKLYPKNDIQYGIIYGVHNIITDRWYIGQTKYTFDIRYSGDFFNKKPNELSEEKRLMFEEDLKKYGEESFKIYDVLDVAFSKIELDEKEVYYIDYYKAYDDGYNSTRGNLLK